MTEKFAGKPTTPETGSNNYVTINPQEIVKDNPAFAYLNPGAIIGPFDLNRYNTEAVAEFVEVLGPKGNKEWLPYNGHNRTAAAAAAGIDALRVRNSTVEILEKYFPGSEQTALTTSQYIERMRVLNNADGDERRMVGQVFNEWKLIVPPEIADRTSALAALHYLSFSEIRDKSPDEIKVVMENPRNPRHPAALVFDETKKEKEEIAAGIVGMARSIDSVNISYQDMLKHGLWVVQQMLTSTDADERESGKKQVRGFVSLPQVHDKITITSDAEGIKERSTLLERLLGVTIANIDVSNDGIQSMQLPRTLYSVLTDPHLTFADVAAVLTPPSRGEIPQSLKQRYGNQKEYRNSQSVLALYRDTVGATGDREEKLVAGLTSRDTTLPTQQQKIVDAVSSAMEFLRDSEGVLIESESASVSGSARGALKILREEIMTTQGKILDAQTVPMLNSKVKQLRAKIIEARALIEKGGAPPVDRLPLSPRPGEAQDAPKPVTRFPAASSSVDVATALGAHTGSETVSDERESAEVVVYSPITDVSLPDLVDLLKEKADGELSDADIAVLVALKNYLINRFPGEGQAEDSVEVVSPEQIVKDDRDAAPVVVNIVPPEAVLFKPPTIPVPVDVDADGEELSEEVSVNFKPKTHRDIGEIVVNNASSVLGTALEAEAINVILTLGGRDFRGILRNSHAGMFKSLSTTYGWDIDSRPELVYMSASIYYNAVLEAIERRPRGRSYLVDLAPVYACADAIQSNLQTHAELSEFGPEQARVLQLYPSLEKDVRKKIVGHLVTDPVRALARLYELHPEMKDKFLNKPPVPDGQEDGVDIQEYVADPVWEARRASYRPDKDGKGNWFDDEIYKKRTTLSEIERHKVTFIVEKVIKDTFGSALSKKILSKLSDEDGNTGLTAIDAMLSERIARLAYNASSSSNSWNRDKPEFQYLIAKFVQRALSAPGRATLPKDQMELLMAGVESKRNNNEKKLKYTSDEYLSFLEFALCTDPNASKYNSMTFRLRTGLDTDAARRMIQDYFTDKRAWRSPSKYGTDPEKDKLAAADRAFVIATLDELYLSTILARTATIEDDAAN